MIKPTKPIETYKQYGFKKCKGEYGKSHCYYLCVNFGVLMELPMNIITWKKNIMF